MAQASLLLFAAVVFSCPVRAAEDPAIAAARKRQHDIRSFEIEFTRSEIVPQGWFTKTPKGLLPGPKPPHDTTLESINRIVVDRNRVRFESNHPIGGAMQFVPWRVISIDDGKTLTEWFPSGMGFENTPMAFLKKTGSFEPLPPLSALPIWWNLRGLDSKFMPYLASDASREGKSRSLDGVACLAVQLRDGRRTLLLYLDPGQDFEPRLIEQSNEGELTCKWEIKNRKYDQYGWLPDSWVRTIYQGSDLRRVSTTRVTRMRLNEAAPDDLFAARFTEGTHVTDTLNRKDLVANADGSLSERMLHEQAGPQPKPRRPSWLAPTAGGILASP